SASDMLPIYDLLMIGSELLIAGKEGRRMAERRPLTKQAVEGIVPQQRDVFVWDSSQPGFGIRVTPAGRRSYVYQFRVRGGPQRRMVLGLHGPLTVQKA